MKPFFIHNLSAFQRKPTNNMTTSADDPEQTSDGLKTASMIGDENSVTVYVVELEGDVQQVSLVAPTDSAETKEAETDRLQEVAEEKGERLRNILIWKSKFIQQCKSSQKWKK